VRDSEAYLCVSPHPGGYPSENYADFVAEDHILAMVTIEWWVGDEPTALPRGDLELALGMFDSASAAGVDALTRVTGLTAGSRIVPARLLLDGARGTEEQRADLCRVIGRSHMRMVPWEIPF
jgi:hypothetical protein